MRWNAMDLRLVPLGLLLAACQAPVEIEGLVLAGGQPLAGARVRLQATPDLPGEPGFVLSDAAGRFVLPLAGRGAPMSGSTGAVTVTAGADGWKVASATLEPRAREPLRLELVPIPPGQRSDYRFTSGAVGGFPCFQCHLSQLRDWQRSTHAEAALDPLVLDELGRFFSWVASGRDLGRGFVDGDGQRYTVVADATAPGECAQCHAPALSLLGESDFRPAVASPDGPRAVREGVTCDVCHKMRGARLDDLTRPGLELADLRFPAPGEEVLFGPLDDVSFTPTGAAFAPAMSTSEICAPCHTNARVLRLRDASGGERVRRIFGEDTFREWRYAPGTVRAVETDGSAAPEASAAGDGPYVTGDNYAGRPLACQDCHMRDPPPDPVTGERIEGYREPGSELRRIATHAAAPLRHPASEPGHRFEGASERMLRWAAELRASARREGGQVVVDVELENRHTGHALPTGLPDRNVLLVVSVSDAGGALVQTEGPMLPAVAGQAGAGRLYARRLAAADGSEPVFYAFAVRDGAEDTRLAPGARDTNHFVFAASGQGGRAIVRVAVVHRRRFPHQQNGAIAETIGDQMVLEVP